MLDLFFFFVIIQPYDEEYGGIMLSNKKGFTLIELLVVVLIIGILAAVAVPQYQIAVAKSRFAILKDLVESVAQAETVYYLAHGTYTIDIEQLDIEHPTAQRKQETNDAEIIYFYKWGECRMTQTQFSCKIDISGVAVNYKRYYNEGAHNRRCIAHTTQLTHLANKLCKNETQKQNPDHPSSPTTY